MAHVVRVSPHGERPAAPDLRVLTRSDGDEPDVCDRLVDLIDRIGEQTQRHAAGDEVPLLEQLDLEREKVDLLEIVGVDALWVQKALETAKQRIAELTVQLVKAAEGAP